MDILARVSLVGIEVLRIDARVVIASVDTYLSFAEAVNRLDMGSKEPAGLPEVVEDVSEAGSKGISKGKTRAPSTPDRKLQELLEPDEEEEADPRGHSRHRSDHRARAPSVASANPRARGRCSGWLTNSPAASVAKRGPRTRRADAAGGPGYPERNSHTARRELEEITGFEAESVTALERAQGGTWRVTVELLELSRIPETDDMLGSFEAELDESGELRRYRRVLRYARTRG